MINQIIDGISIKLNQEFGDGYEIYSEGVKQDLREPCFFIAYLNSSQSRLVGNRYFKQYFFDVHYFPRGGNNKNHEMNEIAEELTDVLEYITVDGDLVRGLEINSEQVNDILHFFVTYNMFIRRELAPVDSMGGLAINSDVRGDSSE